jgi:SlyX protein
LKYALEFTLSTDAERIDGLESQMAFQDETIQQLSDALVAQQTRIDALQVKLEQFLEMRAGETDAGAVDEKPPHY